MTPDGSLWTRLAGIFRRSRKTKAPRSPKAREEPSRAALAASGPCYYCGSTTPGHLARVASRARWGSGAVKRAAKKHLHVALTRRNVHRSIEIDEVPAVNRYLGVV